MSLLYGVQFEYAIQHPEIIINEITLQSPFFGGFNTPKIQWVDWDDDQDIDVFILDEDGIIRFYQNNGDSYTSNFELINLSFQQISNIRWFHFADFNNDELIDLMTQNPVETDQILFYSDIKTEVINPIEVLNNEGNPVLSDGVMTPTFADIDNDGDYDFFTGNIYGTVTFYENIALNNSIPVFQYISNTWQDIYIVGPSATQRHGASAIHFIDLDNDGDLDLSWGDYYQQSLYIIWNIGNATEPNFDIENIISQYPINDPIVTAGQNMPSFADIDGDNDMDLFITVLSGAYGFQLTNNFYFYENEGELGAPNFEYQTQNYFQTLDFFSDIAPSFVDIDADGDQDLFIGTDFDMSVIPWTGRIKFFRNLGSNIAPIYNLEDAEFLGANIGNNLVPEFGDIDGDNDFDLLVGDANGIVWFYINNGDSVTFDFSSVGQLGSIDLSGFAVPRLFDIDYDSDLDLFIGESTGNIQYFENTGNSTIFDFELVSENFSVIGVEYRSAPEFADIDADGDQDILIGSGNTNMKIYVNDNQQFILDETIEIPLLGNNLIPKTVLFGESDLHLFTGISTGGLFHLNIIPCFKGDTTEDELININDVLQIVNIIIANAQITDSLECTADINSDNIINILDIVEIVNIIIR